MVKRLIVVFLSVLALFALSATLGGAAWSAAATSSTPIIVFDDAAQQAELIIPTPACPATQPDCQWKFVLQIPRGDITVGVLFGTSGTLVIPYPKNFCGVIQADAYVGPPFVPKRGFQHTIPQDNCNPPVTTTTTTTTTTTAPPPVPPVVSGGSGGPPTTTPPTTPPPPAAPVAAAPAPTALPFTAAPATAAPTQLPFTGINTKPLWLLGLTLVALGLVLLSSSATWQRARRVLAIVPLPRGPS